MLKLIKKFVGRLTGMHIHHWGQWSKPYRVWYVWQDRTCETCGREEKQLVASS